MQKMYANEYAISRDHPYATIRRLCREGVLPAELEGRKYRIYVEEADAVMDKRKYEPKESMGRVNLHEEKVSTVKPVAAAKGFDYLAELRKASRK